MNTLSAAISLPAHSLCRALLYSLFQGLLIYGSLFILLKAFPNISARVKYYLSFGAFTALFLWFADTWASQYQRLKGITVYITQAGTDTGAGITYQVKTIAGGTHLQNPVIHSLISRLEHYYPLIIIVYTIGLLFMLFRFLVNVAQVRTLRSQGLVQPGSAWDEFITKWERHFEISRPVKLFLSDRISVPMMLGAIKPIILLPVATINHLTTEQVETILLHELAHIKRQDYLLNIFQTIAETILFFNPFVWLISGIIRKEREHCCDDMVVSCSADPLPYAKALALLESSLINDNPFTLAATGHKNQLFHRIKRIMEMKKKNLNYGQLTIIIAAIIALTFTIAMFTITPSFAQQAKGDKEKEKSDTAKKNYYHYKTVTIDANGKKTETDKESSSPIDDKSDGDDDANAPMSDDKSGNNSKTQSYAYTYSTKDGDDMNQAIKEITIATKDAVDAVAKIDFKEIEREVENAEKQIDAVDWNEVRDEINKGIAAVNKELNDPKLRKEINAEVKKALEQSKEALESAQKQMQAANHTHFNGVPPIPPIPPISAAAPVPPVPPLPAPGVHTGNNSYETMLNKMERDGLIDRSGRYSIKKENNELYINDEKQPENVYNKYRKYLNDKTVHIKGHKGSLKITVND